MTPGADPADGDAALADRLSAKLHETELSRTTDGRRTADPSQDSPARFGRYRVLGTLGQGGMGLVLEAIDDSLGRRVAVKTLKPDLATRPDRAARFLAEAQAAAAFRHDNVVPILDYGEEAGVPFLVMPLLAGESLAARLVRGRLPVAEAVQVGRDVATALSAAHGNGLVHRDVKPANVWLDSQTGRALLLDFGLARVAENTAGLTEAGQFVGTPAYVSPEQAEGGPADARSDLFALGVTLHECVTGKRAFSRSSTPATLRAICEHDPPSPFADNPEVPPALSRLIVRLISKNPDDRPASAVEVTQALTEIREGPDPRMAPTESAAISLSPSTSRIFTRRFAWATGVAAVVATAAMWIATLGPLNRDDAQGPIKGRGESMSGVGSKTRLSGNIDVLVQRATPSGAVSLLRLNEPGALPLRKADRFRITADLERPAFLYVVWVDPRQDVTPVYPWNPEAENPWRTRPSLETPTDRLVLPSNVSDLYTASTAKAGVATMVLFARETPLDADDDTVRGWFESLPDLPLPPDGDTAAVWFENYAESKDPLRLRTFGVAKSDDAFARWQGRLQKHLANHADFQAAASFARKGGD